MEGVCELLPLYVLLGEVGSYVSVVSSNKCYISIKVP
jgi:hypothetical protein